VILFLDFQSSIQYETIINELSPLTLPLSPANGGEGGGGGRIKKKFLYN
jgi:hypothetical protein